MLDVTDRHCRYFHRLLSRRALLYTEMVNARAVLHGDSERHLRFDEQEHPVALQLGGSDPQLLAQAARLGWQYGYDEINLNCGCPSPRVQRGAFGARLMRAPALVAQCWQAMYEAVQGRIPITIKHRIGIDRDDGLELVQNFVAQLYAVGCRVFIVHARNAWLQGLSPKDNRSIPPLRYAVAAQLKAQFPAATFVLNGGLQNAEHIAQALALVDGAMIGRQAWHNPWSLHDWDQRWLGSTAPVPQRDAIEAQMVAYMERMQQEQGVPWTAIARHFLGLYHGQRGARAWRRVWSDPHLRTLPLRAVAECASLVRTKSN